MHVHAAVLRHARVPAAPAKPAPTTVHTLLFTIDREGGRERERERAREGEGEGGIEGGMGVGGGRGRERDLEGLETDLKGGGMEAARVTVKPFLYLFRRGVVTVSKCWFRRCRCHLPRQH